MSTTWNPADKNAAISLSNANLTAAATNTAHKMARATLSKDAGKWYWEITQNVAASAYSYHGVATNQATLAGFLGADQYGWSYAGTGYKANANSSTSFGAAFTVGDIVGVAVDIDAGKIWFSKNGVWQAGGNPATGANPAFSNLSGKTLFPSISLYTNTNQGTANFGAHSFQYPIPSGFEGLEVQPITRNLNCQRFLQGYANLLSILNVQRPILESAEYGRLINVQRFVDEYPHHHQYLNAQRYIQGLTALPRGLNVQRFFQGLIALEPGLNVQRLIMETLGESPRVSVWDSLNAYPAPNLSFGLLAPGASSEAQIYLWNDRGGLLGKSQTLTDVELGILCGNGEIAGQEDPLGQEIVDEKWLSVKSNGVLGSGIVDDAQAAYQAIGGSARRSIGDIPPQCARKIHLKMTPPASPETITAYALLAVFYEVE